MALPPATNDAFIREVDEEVRKEQLSQWWARYGRTLLIAVGLLLLALAGVLYWREQRAEKAGLAGEQLLAALAEIDAGNAEAAKTGLDKLAAEGRPGYDVVAKLSAAALAAKNADIDGAVKSYGEVADDSGVAQPFRDFATLRQAMLQFDTLPSAAIQAKLRPLAAPGNPWFGTAGELMAVSHLRDGKPQLAAPLFAALARDANAPPSIRSRAAQMASSLGVDALPPTPAKKLAQ